MESRHQRQLNHMRAGHDSLVGSMETLLERIKIAHGESFSSTVGDNSHPAEEMETLLTKAKGFYERVYRFLTAGYFDTIDQEITFPFQVMGLSFSSSKELNAFFNKPASYPAEFVLGQLMRQTSIDYLRIKQAADREETTAMKIADFVAKRAIAPFESTGLMGYDADDELAIITYPTSRVEVRLLPYTNAIMIGFPVTASGKLGGDFYLSTAFLALAHETGHLLYRSGRTQYTQLDQSHTLLSQILARRLFQQLTAAGKTALEFNWLFNWLEELFADVYGCLVEGPVYIAGFQDLMITDHPSDNLGNSPNPKYPVPALRPLIHAQIIESLADSISRFEGFAYPQNALKQHNSHAAWQTDFSAGIASVTQTLNRAWALDIALTWPLWVQQAWPYGFEDDQGNELLGNLESQSNGVNPNLLTQATYEVQGQALIGDAILSLTQIAIDQIINLMLESGVQADGLKWQNLEVKNPQDSNLKDQLIHEFSKSVRNQIGLSDLSGEDENPLLGNQGPLAKVISQAKVSHIDEFVNLLIFTGWSDEGPKTGSSGN